MWLSLVEYYVRDVGAAGSNPVTSTNIKDGIPSIRYTVFNAAVVELADTRDLKSLGSNIVPVQVRSAALLNKGTR